MKSNIVRIFETNFNNCTLSEACNLLEDFIKAKQHFIYIAVKDVALTVRSHDSDFLKKFYNEIPECIFVDGKGIVYASWLLNKPLKEMVGAPGLYYEMLKRGENIYKFFFLGSNEQYLQTAIENVKKRHPGIRIVGCRNGYFSEEDEQKIIKQIDESNCDVLFLAMPTPLRERFIHRNKNDLSPCVCIAIGGVLDVEAGKVHFAPHIIRIMGMEWLYRVAQEPRRLAGRYFYTHTKFIHFIFNEVLIKLIRKA